MISARLLSSRKHESLLVQLYRNQLEMLSHKIKLDDCMETDPEMENVRFEDIKLLENEDDKKAKEEIKIKAREMLSKLKVVTAA